MSYRSLLSVLTLATLVLLSGCGQPAGGGVDTPSPSAGDPVVTVVRTGGFAGVHDQVTVAADGTWTATDRAGSSRSGRLSDDQREKLRGLAADPRLAQESAQTRPATRCADAFEYALTVNTTRVHFVDCPTDEDLPRAAIAVVALVTQAVWGHPPATLDS
jgi:hypothetical protein